METQTFEQVHKPFVPWNKGKVTGQKPPLKPREVWAIRVRLQIANRVRDLALFNLAIDSKLLAATWCIFASKTSCRAIRCEHGRSYRSARPVRRSNSKSPSKRAAVAAWVRGKDLKGSDWLFPSRVDPTQAMTTRQYGRLVDNWIAEIGLSPAAYGTHSLRRTKAALIYRKTGNIRAVQLLLGHTKLDNTVRYLGVEVEDALAIAEGIDV